MKEQKVVDIESLRNEFYTFKTEINERIDGQTTRIDNLSFKFDEMKHNMETSFESVMKQVKTIENSSKHNYKLVIGSLILIFLFILLFII